MIAVDSLIQMANEMDKYRARYSSYEGRSLESDELPREKTLIVPDHFNTKPYPVRYSLYDDQK